MNTPCHTKKMSSVLLKHWYQKYPPCCLTCDRTLLPVNSYHSWKRGRGSERFGEMLYSSLSLGICVYLARHHLLDGRTTALNPSVSKARGVTSRSNRTRITLKTQKCHHNWGTDYEKYPATAKRMNTAEHRRKCVSVNVHVWACESFALTLFPAALLSSLEGLCVYVCVCMCICMLVHMCVFHFRLCRLLCGVIVPQTADDDKEEPSTTQTCPHTQDNAKLKL